MDRYYITGTSRSIGNALAELLLQNDSCDYKKSGELSSLGEIAAKLMRILKQPEQFH